MSLRSDLLPVPERFASERRSTEPEIFTFESVPVQSAPVLASAVRCVAPIRPRRRCTRVQYPATVRWHLPPPERNPVKRWLLLLVLVLLWQIYTEDPDPEDRSLGPAALVPDGRSLAPDYRSLAPHYRSLAPDYRRCPAAPLPAPLPAPEGSPDGLVLPDSPVPEQSTGKSCMVALLVYHHLGSDS